MKLLKLINQYSKVEILIVYLLVILPLCSCLILSYALSLKDIKTNNGISRYIPKCKYKTYTGKECLTCGLTRGFTAISHGDFKKAVKFNKYSIFWYSVFCFIIISFTILFLIILVIKRNVKINLNP